MNYSSVELNVMEDYIIALGKLDITIYGDKGYSNQNDGRLWEFGVMNGMETMKMRKTNY